MNDLTLTVFCDPLLHKRFYLRIEKGTGRYPNAEISINGRGDLSFFILKNIKGAAKQKEMMCSTLKKKVKYKWKSPERHFMPFLLDGMTWNNSLVTFSFIHMWKVVNCVHMHACMCVYVWFRFALRLYFQNFLWKNIRFSWFLSLENHLKRKKDLFWLSVSEVSVNGHLVLWPLGLLQDSTQWEWMYGEGDERGKGGEKERGVGKEREKKMRWKFPVMSLPP